MPPDQFQQLMGMVSAGGLPGAGMGGMRGMPPGAGGAGGNVIRLTEEEGAAVARLAELGFDRTDAAQVGDYAEKSKYLALRQRAIAKYLPPEIVTKTYIFIIRCLGIECSSRVRQYVCRPHYMNKLAFLTQHSYYFAGVFGVR